MTSNDMKQAEYLRKQIEIGFMHNDSKYVAQCEKELREIDPCCCCPKKIVKAVASQGGDGYGQTFSYCDYDCPKS